MSKEEVIAAIVACAHALGRNPTFSQLKREHGVTARTIHVHFSTFAQALRESGLQPVGRGYRLETSKLLENWAATARTLGKLPTMVDYERHGTYSTRPLMLRFQNWKNIPRAMRRYAEQNGREQDWADVLAMIRDYQHELPPLKMVAAPRARHLPGRPVYGPPLAPNGLAHEPVNEAGVVYLFGMLAGRLGYVATHLQADFPDCEALREFETGRWQRVRIEFEFESRNFLVHGHPAGQCDLIVCWAHNWPECPLEVLELSKVVNHTE